MKIFSGRGGYGLSHAAWHLAPCGRRLVSFTAIPLAVAFVLGGAVVPAASLAAQQAPVQVTLTVVPAIAQPGDTVTIRVTLAIAVGWYVYRTAGSAGQHKLALTLTLPTGIEPAGTWVWPKGEDVFEGTAVEIYRGAPTFTRRLRLTAALAATDTVTLGATIGYQACNAQLCAPLTVLDVSTVLQVRAAAPAPTPGTGSSAPVAPVPDSTRSVNTLVGHLVPAPLAAPHWLNATRGMARVSLTAPATLVEFTWPGCVDCAKGYPTLRALARRYSDRGLRLVFMTYLFGSTPVLEVATVDQELAYDQHFWRIVQPLPFPIGVLDQSAGFPPLFATYAVTGAPTYYLIDRHGIVRYAQRGHRTDLATWLTTGIEQLLRSGS